MFWRFGFHACSAIDTLLDKPDVTLEVILGEDDLLQECKAHNTKLIEYLRDPNILSKLLNYIIADDQIDDKAKFKYSPRHSSPFPPFFIRIPPPSRPDQFLGIPIFPAKSFRAKSGLFVKLSCKIESCFQISGPFWTVLRP
jgi:hypothetical protein